VSSVASNPRILFVYQICSLGGVESVLRNRAVGLARLGAPARIAVLEDLGGGATFDGVDGFEGVRDEARLREILDSGTVDVVATIDTPSVYPVVARSRFRGRVVTEVHSNNFANLGYLERIADSGTDLLIVPSAFEGELIRREYPAVTAAKLPIRVVPNPVDTELFRFAPPHARLPSPLIAWVGRLEPQKNWPHFLAVAGDLARRRPDLGFVCVGGIAATQAVKDEFRERVRANDLMGRLRWVPSLAFARMPALYSAVAASGGCLVPTSSFEPFGMTALEAMACRCPVVAARSGGLGELVEDGVNGLGFSVDDTEAAVGAIVRVLDDGALRAQLVNSASARIRERFEARAVARGYLEALAA